MKLLKQTHITVGAIIGLACLTMVAMSPQPALADNTRCANPNSPTCVQPTPQPDTSTKAKDKSADTGVKCTVLPDSICKKAGTNSGGHSAIWYFLILILNILTAGVGVAAVIGIIIAAILYSSAEDKPDQVHKAKDMIWNIVLGLVCYLAMYALLQFIIPGGIFSK